MKVSKITPTKALSQVKCVELSEDGATVILAVKEGEPEKKIFLNQDQIAQVWGMLTIGLDAATFGQLSGKIRRLGLWSVIQESLQGAKMVRDDDRQSKLSFVKEG